MPNTPFAMVLVGISGLCWTLVYLGIINRGRKDHVHGMPLYALGLNIAWEVLYSMDGLFFHHTTMIPLQIAANCVWAFFDVIIFYQYFKYGRSELPGGDRYQKYFIPYSVMAIFICVMGQLAFYLHTIFTGDPNPNAGSQYSAFAQNVIMSAAFLAYFMRRGDAKGQSFTVAIAKCIGTLTPTLLGTIYEHHIFILLTGICCFILDVTYIVVLFVYNKNASPENKVAVF